MQPPLDQNVAGAGEQEYSDKTFGNQGKLPVVPLPNLQYTCATFMEWCSPLLTEEEKQQTQAAVDQFARPGGPGEKLHESLINYARQPEVKSWLDRFWETRYLGRRDEIALNANFFFMFPDQNISQVQRAVRIISQALHYKLELDQEKIPPLMQRGKPLCMNQNKWLFSATRIPGAPLDSLRSPYSKETPGPSKATHILVHHRGHIFRMDVIGPNGKPHSLDDIEKGIIAILGETAERLDEGECVGHLTTKRREHWVGVRQQLIDLAPENRASLDEIETALFSICLEDKDPEEQQEVTDTLLHGDSGNRWFDKALQFIILRNGSAGLNIEHCGLDGTTILNLIDAMSEFAPAEAMKKSGAEEQGQPAINPVTFNLDDNLKAEVLKARDDFQKLVHSTATSNFVFSEFGATKIKSLKVSPDAFAQLGYQLAHYLTRGKTGATYESIATRTYENGRTEAMRVITPEILSFVESCFNEDASDQDRITAFRAAANKHVERAKQCQAGQAPEQHLWEMLNIYNAEKEQLGITEDLPLFETPGWIKVRHDYLSTSSAPSNNIVYFGFGSTSSECIGIGYVLDADELRFYLSIPRQHEAELPVFAENLKTSFIKLAELLSEGE
ncbi:MAG: choline/carnitine O-acyltransferase [Methyloligellaceae bacterium]